MTPNEFFFFFLGIVFGADVLMAIIVLHHDWRNRKDQWFRGKMQKSGTMEHGDVD